MTMARLWLGMAFGLATVAGCGDVVHSMHSDHTGQHGTRPSAPHVTVAPLTLTLGPTQAQLAAYFCPFLGVTEPLSTAAAAACRSRGPAPEADDLAVNVRIDATIASGNPIRLEASSALFVITLYPGAGANQVVGALCLTLCDADAHECPQTDEACHTSSTDVIDLGDVAPAHDFMSSVAFTEHRYAELAVRDVPAHGQASLVVDAALSAEPLVTAIQNNDTAALTAMRAGQQPTFAVPYAVEGTIWVEGRGNDGFAYPIERATGTLELPN